MASNSSSYSYSSQPYFSEDDSAEFSRNIINNSNTIQNPYRTSLFIEESPDSNRRTINGAQLNIVNRTSTHSFMVFIDDSVYGNIPSSSASLWSEVNSSSSNANIASLNNKSDKPSENITFRVTNPTNTHDNVSFVNSNSSNSASPTVNTNSSYFSNIHTSNFSQIPTINKELPVIPRQKKDDLLLRRKVTPESMNTGDTEYFETNEFITSTNNINEDDVQLFSTSTKNIASNVTNDKNSTYSINGNSTDSIDTQNTEILDTRIRNSHSLLPNIRDSVRTLSTIVLTQNRDSSITTKGNKKILNPINQNGEVIGISMQEEILSKGQTSTRNRTSSFTTKTSSNPSNYISSRNNLQINISSTEVNQMSSMEPSYSSIFQYDDYNDTIEPDVKQAVKLLKKEVKTSTPKVNYVHPKRDSNVIFIPENKKRGEEEEEELIDKDNISINSRSSSIKFIPHELKIPCRLSISQPQTPIITASESHVPRSPSLINKFLVTSSSKMKGSPTFPPYNLHKRNISLTNHATVTPLYGSISFNTKIPSTSSVHSTAIPKVQVLQSVSGPSRWKPSPKTENHIVSMLSSNEFKNPIKKLLFHENMRDSLQESTSIQHHNITKIESLQRLESDNIIHEMSTLRNDLSKNFATISPQQTNIIPPLPTRENTFYNAIKEIPENTTVDYNNDAEDINTDKTNNLLNNDTTEYPIYIQHIDLPSIHSFDSQSYKFWEIYSIQRMISLLIVCFIFPPLFFMIYMGSTCGIDDYRLMKLILNKEHRIGLFRGFLWDIDLNWVRTLSLLLGCVELIIVLASVGIGFGVGLTR